MRVYLNLGQRDLEKWLQETAGERIACVSFEEADYVLVNRVSDAERAREAGKKVLFVAGQNDKEGKLRASKAQELGACVLSWTWREKEEAASLILSFLLTADRELPTVELRDEAYKVLIRSSGQSGGTFLAWNLLRVLQKRGYDVQLLTACDNSPLSTWTKWEERVKIGSMQGEAADVWLIDGTGTGPTETIEADVMIFVFDGDPAKPQEPVDGAEPWRVLNRVPVVAQEEHLGFNLVLPDFGVQAWQAMRTGVPVVVNDGDLEDVLWAFWESIRAGQKEVRFTMKGSSVAHEHSFDESGDEQMDNMQRGEGDGESGGDSTGFEIDV